MYKANTPVRFELVITNGFSLTESDGPKAFKIFDGDRYKMLPFKTILCPFDFDENSEMALDKGIEIARHFGSSLILVHVLPLVLTLGEVPPPAALYEEQAKAARTKLADVAKKKLAGLKNEFHIYTGDVIGSILRAQNEHQCDLLVMATHGRIGLARMFLGSVAAAIVRKASCPVLTIREEPGLARVVGSKRHSKAGNVRSDRK